MHKESFIFVCEGSIKLFAREGIIILNKKVYHMEIYIEYVDILTGENFSMSIHLGLQNGPHLLVSSFIQYEGRGLE